MNKTGFIYAISDGNHVKIGWSLDPIDRLRTLNTGHAAELKLLGVVSGSLATEAALHKSFAAHRVRGEWFENLGAVTEFIATLSPPQPRPWSPHTAGRPLFDERTRRIRDSFLAIQRAILAEIRATWPTRTAQCLASVGQITVRQAERVLARQRMVSLELFWNLLESEVVGRRFWELTLKHLTAEWANGERRALDEREEKWRKGGA